MSNDMNTQIVFVKPGMRISKKRDIDRKDQQLKKYLRECQLFKKVNFETHPERSERIEQMYNDRKVIKSRKGSAKNFNFKKEGATKILKNISNNFKNEKEFENKKINRKQIQEIHNELYN